MAGGRMAAAIAVFAMAVGGATGAAVAQGTTATAAIGGLWLTIDPAVWDVQRSDRDAVITCLAKECRGAVVDVAFEVTDARCDDRSTVDAVRAAYPDLPSIAVNLHVWDGLAFFVGEAAPEGAFRLETGRAVYACLEWGDSRYEFRSRVDGPIPDYQGAVVFDLLRAFWADPLPEIVLPLAGLELHLPADRWEVTTDGPLAYSPATGGLINCTPPQCDDRVFLNVTAEEAAPGETSCLPTALAGGPTQWASDADVGDIATITTADGVLTLDLVTIHSMCRAWTPPHFGACVIHDGVRYSFWTGNGAGCHFGPYIGEGAFLDLVQSLRPVTTP